MGVLGCCYAVARVLGLFWAVINCPVIGQVENIKHHIFFFKATNYLHN